MYCETKTFTIGKFFVEKNSIDLSPEYQRESGAWGREKQQLFLDTLFNQYDVPKIYLHALKRNGGLHSYALVDGKQRLQCIWDFLEGNDDNNSQLGDMSNFQPNEPAMRHATPYPASGNSYSELSPFWQEQFRAMQLDVVIIHDAEPNDIEEIFSRLNNGEPLNAAEKRNAMGGHMCALIREMSRHKFFTETISVPTKRYQHYDIAARFLLIEEAVMRGASPYRDLKKRFLDSLARDNRDMDAPGINELKTKVKKQLNVVVKIFDKKDPLLRRASYPQLYYLFAKEMEHYASTHLHSQMKSFLIKFNQLRVHSLRLTPEEKTGEKHAVLDQFERLTQQANDAKSLETRVSTMLRFFLEEFPNTKRKDPQRNFSDGERYAIYTLSGGQCDECKKTFNDFHEFEADHEVQWVHGGETTLKNARALCKPCNAKLNKKVA